MKQLINEVYEIIKDYRQDEEMMSIERIEQWIEQFNADDRIFILEEMKNIFGKRYISKAKAKTLVKEMIEFLSQEYKYDNPKSFLLECSFLDHQPEGKSQKILLAFLNEILAEEYQMTIENCNPKKPKFYIYFDDVLCTGDTLVKGLTKNTPDSKGWFHKTREDGRTNLDAFKEDKAKLILAYFAIHKHNIKKAISRIYYGLNKTNIDIVYAWDKKYEIENDVDNINSKLNFIFPKESVRNELVINCQNQIEEKIKSDGYHEGETIRYREINKPMNEEFYSSEANRDRFEKIILEKCIQIYNSSERLMTELRPKPLGYGLYTDLSLGFGTLIFTWRNVPFNVPLVFWYKNRDWTSLFERKFVNYEH
jgi:hypothetical protein